MGNIGTASQSNPVTTHEIFNNIIMKIIDNSNGKKGAGKSLIFGGCAGLICLAAIIMIVIAFTGKGENVVEAEENQVVENDTQTETLPSEVNVSTQTPTPSPTETPVVSMNEEILHVIEYTGMECDEDTLKQLVLDTMSNAENRISTYLESGKSRSFVLFIDSLNEQNFTHDDQLKEEVIVDGVEEIPSITWLDACGSAGTVIFNAMDDPFFNPVNYHSNAKYLAHMVAYGVYGFELTKDNLSVQGVEYGNSLEISDEMFDVNFEVYFEHENEKHVALIGNLDGSYRVLDIINVDDYDHEDVTATNSNDTTTEDNSYLSTPSDTPTDHTYDNQQGNSEIPDLSGDSSTWPCIPGYEYKPGTEYVYPIGWIPSNGGTRATPARDGEIIEDPSQGYSGY